MDGSAVVNRMFAPETLLRRMATRDEVCRSETVCSLEADGEVVAGGTGLIPGFIVGSSVSAWINGLIASEAFELELIYIPLLSFDHLRYHPLYQRCN